MLKSLLLSLTIISGSALSLEINKVLELNLDAPISPATYNYVQRAYAMAKTQSIDLILFKLNTPGGLISSTRDIITQIGASPVPTAIWITPEGASATSAGAIIASAAHLLFMSPGSNIGAATPVSFQQNLPEGDLRNKLINDLVALSQSLANARGRNSTPIAAMIEKSESFTAEESLEKKIIDAIIDNNADFIAAINGRQIILKGEEVTLSCKNPEFIEMQKNIGQHFLDTFADPQVAYVMLILGAALIFLEIQALGGIFWAGLAGLLCLVMAGLGLQVLPLNLGALSLIAIAFGFFVLEAFITSYGVLSLIGLSSLAAGSLFLFSTDDSYIETSKTLVIAATATVGLFLLFLGWFWYNDRTKPDKPKENQIEGKRGIIVAILRDQADNYEYHVRVQGAMWRARSKTKYSQGSEVVIAASDPQTLTLYLEEESKS